MDSQVRVANLKGLISLNLGEDDTLLLSLLDDKSEAVRASAYKYSIARGLPEMESKGMLAIKNDSFDVASKVMEIFVKQTPESMVGLWQKRELELRPELWLDLYFFLSNSDHVEAQKWPPPTLPVLLAEFMPLVFTEETVCAGIKCSVIRELACSAIRLTKRGECKVHP